MKIEVKNDTSVGIADSPKQGVSTVPGMDMGTETVTEFFKIVICCYGHCAPACVVEVRMGVDDDVNAAF